MVPRAAILLTGCELPTYGDLYVKRHTGAELVLGQTWGAGNRVGLREEDEGTVKVTADGGKELRSKGPHLQVYILKRVWEKVM